MPGDEYWDSKKEEFFTIDDLVVTFEHSLVSLSKWEAIHLKPFITEDEKSSEEILSYVECMILDPDLAPEALRRLDDEAMTKINDYMNSKQTATWFPEEPKGAKSREKITSELIYYWMIAFDIPWEAQHWHLERLFTLIKVCNVKNSPPKKRSPQEMAQERARINAERLAQTGSRG